MGTPISMYVHHHPLSSPSFFGLFDDGFEKLMMILDLDEIVTMHGGSDFPVDIFSQSEASKIRDVHFWRRIRHGFNRVTFSAAVSKLPDLQDCGMPSLSHHWLADHHVFWTQFRYLQITEAKNSTTPAQRVERKTRPTKALLPHRTCYSNHTALIHFPRNWFCCIINNESKANFFVVSSLHLFPYNLHYLDTNLL